MRPYQAARFLSAVLVPVLALTACTGSSGGSGDGDKQVNLTVWSWDGTVAKSVPGFESANPNIKVKVANAGSSFDEYTALDNAIQARSGVPDLAMFEYFAVPYFAIPGKLYDLGKYSVNDLKKDYLDAAWSDVTVGGKVYALPSDYGPSAMFYNDATLKKAGSQSLTVSKDPNDGTTEADIQKQTAMLMNLRKDVESAADMVNQIENIRAQLNKLRADHPDVKQAADDFEKKLTDIEDGLIQRRYSGQGQDTTRFGPKLIGKMTYLGSGVAGGDYPPNKQQQEVKTMFESQLASLRKQLDALVSGDLNNFNRMLRDKNIGNVIASGQ